MAKGAKSKQEVAKAILKCFGDKAFLYNDGKEVRVNTTEDGELVQIKIALTAAKTPVAQGDEDAIPTAAADNKIEFEEVSKDKIVEATPEAVAEFDRVVRINESLLRHLIVKVED